MNNEEIIKQFGEHSNALRLAKVKTIPVVAEGNVIEGFDLYGPFESDEAAIEWAYAHCTNTWVVVTVNHPDQKET